MCRGRFASGFCSLRWGIGGADLYAHDINDRRPSSLANAIAQVAPQLTEVATANICEQCHDVSIPLSVSKASQSTLRSGRPCARFAMLSDFAGTGIDPVAAVTDLWGRDARVDAKSAPVERVEDRACRDHGAARDGNTIQYSGSGADPHIRARSRRPAESPGCSNMN